MTLATISFDRSATADKAQETAAIQAADDRKLEKEKFVTFCLDPLFNQERALRLPH